MKTRLRYIWPFSFLIVVILLTWYLFFCRNIATNNDERIVGVLAFLALGFGIFQYWLSELNTDRRKLFELRYDTYKEFILLIDQVSDTLNMEMTGNEINNVYELVSRLMNNINKINSSINMNRDFLFPDIHLKSESKEIKDILEKILLQTDQFRQGLENANKEGKEVAREFLQSIEKMNWHNEILEHLKKLHNKKYDFYRILRTYIMH